MGMQRLTCTGSSFSKAGVKGNGKRLSCTSRIFEKEKDLGTLFLFTWYLPQDAPLEKIVLFLLKKKRGYGQLKVSVSFLNSS